MSNQNYKEIDHRGIQPDAKLWLRIEDKLDGVKTERKLVRYQRIALAASILAIVFSSAYLYTFYNHYRSEAFAFNDKSHPVIIEQMSGDVSPLYDLVNLRTIKYAYEGIN
ncbi:MAG: hypothetical protein H6572_03410 [Lewinellaceae bacterium]|nr:hypothetical protein [Lewinellaceae bacterium]